jgi:hypothetical protein
MASITLNIRNELPKAVRWTDAMTKQLPFSISQALNATGFDARKSLNGATRQYFDRPTKFIQKSFLVRKSTKRNLIVEVYPDAKRKPYIGRNITGGTRGQKPFELRYQSLTTGNLPQGNALIPAAIRTNANGNVSLATIKRISRQVATKGSNSVFIGQPKGAARPPGVYQRYNRNKRLRPLFLSVDLPSYRPIFPINEIGAKVAERRFGVYLRQYLAANVAKG